MIQEINDRNKEGIFNDFPMHSRIPIVLLSTVNCHRNTMNAKVGIVCLHIIREELTGIHSYNSP